MNPLVDGLTEHLRTAKADLASARQALAAAEQKAATERAARMAAESELQRLHANGEIAAVLEQMIREALAKHMASMPDTSEPLNQMANRLAALETAIGQPADISPLVFDVKYDGNGDVRQIVARAN